MEEEIQAYMMLSVVVCFTSTLIGAVLTVTIMMLDFSHNYTFRTGVVAGLVKQSILFTVASNSSDTPINGADAYKVIYAVGEEFETINLAVLDENGNYVNSAYDIQDVAGLGYVTDNLEVFLGQLYHKYSMRYFVMEYSIDNETEFVHLKITEVRNN